MLANVQEEIGTLKDAVAALDKTVAEATEQRKQEHAEYQETLSMTKTAVELIGKAKNRLAKFYTPALYKAPSKEEGDFFAQVSEHRGHRASTTQPEMPTGLGKM